MGKWPASDSSRVPTHGAASLPDAPGSVIDLVRRFALRRRAATEEFMAGVDLARDHVVRLHRVEAAVVTGAVEEDSPANVTLEAVSGQLVGHCSCGSLVDPCRHQVAVAHTLWTRGRAAIGYRSSGARSDHRQ